MGVLVLHHCKRVTLCNSATSIWWCLLCQHWLGAWDSFCRPLFHVSVLLLPFMKCSSCWPISYHALVRAANLVQMPLFRLQSPFLLVSSCVQHMVSGARPRSLPESLGVFFEKQKCSNPMMRNPTLPCRGECRQLHLKKIYLKKILKTT